MSKAELVYKWLNDDAIRACFEKICAEAEVATTGDQGAVSLAFHAAEVRDADFAWVEDEEPAFVTEGRRQAKDIIEAVGIAAQQTLPLVEDDFEDDFMWAHDVDASVVSSANAMGFRSEDFLAAKDDQVDAQDDTEDDESDDAANAQGGDVDAVEAEEQFVQVVLVAEYDTEDNDTEDAVDAVEAEEQFVQDVYGQVEVAVQEVVEEVEVVKEAVVVVKSNKCRGQKRTHSMKTRSFKLRSHSMKTRSMAAKSA
jgi:hypothetical protein